MELKILEDTKKRLKMEIHGVDHTFCNALKNQLWEDGNITVTGYRIDHPQTGVPTMIVESEGSVSPKEALLKSVQKLNKDYEKFKKLFAKQVK